MATDDTGTCVAVGEHAKDFFPLRGDTTSSRGGMLRMPFGTIVTALGAHVAPAHWIPRGVTSPEVVGVMCLGPLGAAGRSVGAVAGLKQNGRREVDESVTFGSDRTGVLDLNGTRTELLWFVVVVSFGLEDAMG